MAEAPGDKGADMISTPPTDNDNDFTFNDSGSRVDSGSRGRAVEAARLGQSRQHAAGSRGGQSRQHDDAGSPTARHETPRGPPTSHVDRHFT